MQMAYRAECLELGAICWAVLLGVVAEDSCTVEGAVIFGEVQPALEPMRALAADAKPNDVRGAARDTEPVSRQTKYANHAC